MGNLSDLTGNSLLYIGVAVLLLIVFWQSAVFLVRALNRAKELNIDSVRLKTAVKVSALTSIVPSIAIVIALITLAPVLGIPVSWGRLSIIGSLSYELLAANIGAEAAGVELGGAGYDATAFLTSVTTMTIGSFASLSIAIFLFKPYKNKLARTLSKSDSSTENPWSRVLMATLIVSLYARFLAEPVVKGGSSLITMIASAIIMLLLTLLTKKVGKLKWLSDFSLSISMILAMTIAVLPSL